MVETTTFVAAVGGVIQHGPGILAEARSHTRQGRLDMAARLSTEAINILRPLEGLMDERTLDYWRDMLQT